MSSARHVTGLLEALDPLRTDVDREAASGLLRDARSLLADGVDAVPVDDVDRFAVLAERFGLYADAWNALTLRRPANAVPAALRGVALRAFVATFPESARRRPDVLVAIANGQDGAVDRDVILDALAFWCARLEDDPDATDASVVEALMALGQVLDRTGPASLEPSDLPSDLVSRYVALAGRVAMATEASGVATSGSGSVLARALVWSEALREAHDAAATPPAVGEGGDPSGHRSDPADGVPTSPSADEASRPTPVHPPEPPSSRPASSVPTDIFAGRGRIVVIGALSVDWSHLVGVAKSMGIPQEALTHVGYDEVKQRGLFGVVHVSDVGVLVGPVPHKIQDGGTHGSPVQQAKAELGLPVIDLRAHSASRTLKITKSTFREGLNALVRELAIRSSEARAAVAA